MPGTWRARARLLWTTRRLVPVFMGALALLPACTTDAADDGRPRVLTTTPLIAEFASRVAGDDAGVDSLIPAGVDLHSYEPPAEAARRVTEADLLLVNGYRLEESLLDVLAENRAPGTRLLAVSAGAQALKGGQDAHDKEEDDGHAAAGESAGVEGPVFDEGDPHLWLDVANAQIYVENIRDALVDVDPEHAAGYRERAETVLAELRELDAEIRAMLEPIPPERRTIVVFHDAFQYFAHAYEFELTTAIASGSGAQPSSSAVADIIDLVRSKQIPAVYKEPAFSSEIVELVAREGGARVLTLYDTFAEGVDSYEALMRANAEALVEGLGR